MKFVVFLLGYLALASKAASIGEEGNQAAAEATAGIGTSLDSADTIQPGELEEFTGLNPSSTIAEVTTAEATKPSEKPSKAGGANTAQAAKPGVDVLPFPLSVFLRLISKEALQNFDPSSFCDTIQMLDVNEYRDMLLKEDYAGFQQKLSQDDVLNTLGETFQDYLMKYPKIITEGNSSVIEKNVKDILKVFSLDKNQQNPVSIDKTMKDWINLLVSERSVARDRYLALQKYVKLMQETLPGRNLLNALNLSQKDAAEKALNGKGV